MRFNYSKLRGRMCEMGVTQAVVAKKIGINEGTLSAKLNGKAYFSTVEIDKICQVLHIKNSEIGAYFYAR